MHTISPKPFSINDIFTCANENVFVSQNIGNHGDLSYASFKPELDAEGCSPVVGVLDGIAQENTFE